MVLIDRVVTRGGDGGQTSLGDGARVSKDDARVEAYGTVDEANAAIGVLRLYTTGHPAIDMVLASVQNDLFDVGADLCVPGEGGDRLRVTAAVSARVEQAVFMLNAALAPLTSFVLPGGSAGSAHAHLARTIVRRAETAGDHAGATTADQSRGGACVESIVGFVVRHRPAPEHGGRRAVAARLDPMTKVFWFFSSEKNNFSC